MHRLTYVNEVRQFEYRICPVYYLPVNSVQSNAANVIYTGLDFC